MERLCVRHEAVDEFTGSDEDRAFAGIASDLRQDDDDRGWLFSAEVAGVLADNDLTKAKEYSDDNEN